MDADFEPGSSIEFILTLPREITMAGDVHIRCFAEIVRVEPHNGRRGIAARIDRYEFLPTSALLIFPEFFQGNPPHCLRRAGLFPFAPVFAVELFATAMTGRNDGTLRCQVGAR